MLGLDLGIIIGLVGVLAASLTGFKLSFFEEWGIIIMSFVGVALIFISASVLNSILLLVFSLTAVLTLAAALDGFPLIEIEEEK
jgi:ABC-type uncharacterized transport system permease subunit